MAERTPSPGNDDKNNESPEIEPQPNDPMLQQIRSSSSLARTTLLQPCQAIVLHNYNQSPIETLEAGTYVIQVPKDQIYRIPPPENAIIVQHHRDPSKTKKPLCFNFACLGLLGFFLLFITLLVAGLYLSVAKSDVPRFAVKRFVYNNKTKSHRPDYTVTLKSQNPNSHVVILYKKLAQGGSLMLKTQEIATGSFPGFEQESGNSRVFDVIFHGSKIKLPKEIEKSSTRKNKQKNGVKFSMSMDIPGRMSRGALKKSVMFQVDCDFTVDSLVKGTRVLNQQCSTKRK